MDSSVRTTSVPSDFLFRWAARAAGAVTFVMWLELVVIDSVRTGSPDFRNFAQPIQAATLFVVFAGYLIGWRNELAGGLLSIFGTAVFGVVCVLTFGVLHSIAVVWFAALGLLYLIAWHGERRHRKLIL